MRKVYRIGYVSPGPGPAGPAFNALVQGLRDQGLAVGRNLVIEERYAENKGLDRVRALIAELIALKVDALVTVTTAVALEAKNSTRTIPIIMAVSTDPVGGRVVDSLAHPGGNVTGMTLSGPELTVKRVELLKTLAPNVARIVITAPSDVPVYQLYLREIERVARPLGIHQFELATIGVEPAKWDDAFAAFSRMPNTALVVAESPSFLHEAATLATLALRYRLPAVYGLAAHAREGGIMSYGADVANLFHRAADIVGKVLLHGARPADLPVEQPTKFELIINMNAAKGLGLAIPPALLLRADQVIE